jgi:hypothetical protein
MQDYRKLLNEYVKKPLPNLEAIESRQRFFNQIKWACIYVTLFYGLVWLLILLYLVENQII